MSRKLLILMVVFLHYENSFSAFVGQPCIAERQNGTCKLLRDCDRAIQELNKLNKLYTKCTPLPDYVGFNPIVCCLPKTVEIEEDIPKEWENLPVSEQKCRQHHRKMYGNFSPNFSPRPQRRHRCPFNAIETIAGGTKASQKEFPHMVLLGYEKNEDDEDDGEEYAWKCGGTLISELYVLTAAHCNAHRTIILALLGILKIQGSNQNEVRGAVAVYDYRADAQYKYDPLTRSNDILLVKLNDSVSFNEYILPACLPSPNLNIGTVFIATGWGATQLSTSHSQSNHLLRVELYELANCKFSHFNETTQICAGSETEFKNTCRGDSGGPLLIRHRDMVNTPCMYTIVGIVAYGRACLNTTSTKSAYTKVSAYVKWIECRVWGVGCDLL